MNFKLEHGIIAVLVLALLYYVSSHHSLLDDLSLVSQSKVVMDKHRDTHPGVCWGCTKAGTCCNSVMDTVQHICKNKWCLP